MGNILGIGAVILYALATYKLVSRLMHPDREGQMPFRPVFFGLGYAALMLHALVVYQNISTASGLNLGFYNALSLTSWCVALFVLFTALFRPLENLAVIIFPMTILALLLDLFLTSSRILPDEAPAGLVVHVILSICAYSLLTIAALQALLLALQHRQIANKHPASIMRLPPMQIMDDLLIQIIAIGFFMLSLSLATGFMFLNDIFGQHLAHKTILSILAWIIFGILLWGRWARGWRGKTAIRWTLGGFAALLLAYFGTKIVLELILKRV